MVESLVANEVVAGSSPAVCSICRGALASTAVCKIAFSSSILDLDSTRGDLTVRRPSSKRSSTGSTPASRTAPLSWWIKHRATNAVVQVRLLAGVPTLCPGGPRRDPPKVDVGVQLAAERPHAGIAQPGRAAVSYAATAGVQIPLPAPLGHRPKAGQRSLKPIAVRICVPQLRERGGIGRRSGSRHRRPCGVGVQLSPFALCRRGGTHGRRAPLRRVYPKGCASSSLAVGTMLT